MLPSEEPRLLMSDELEKIVDIGGGGNQRSLIEIFVDGSRVCSGGVLRSLFLSRHELKIAALFKVDDVDTSLLKKCILDEVQVKAVIDDDEHEAYSIRTFSCTLSKKDNAWCKCTLVFNI